VRPLSRFLCPSNAISSTKKLERGRMTINRAGNILAKLPQSISEEVFQQILHGERFRLERIISSGQATPAGQWYDQEQHEWVVLLSGAAGLRFEGEEGLRILSPGDFVNIPAHTRHRVEWTDEKQSTVWLALHYSRSDAAQLM
jgi:cupin 2 domain-containing protein